jgi:hypothetical protein
MSASERIADTAYNARPKPILVNASAAQRVGRRVLGGAIVHECDRAALALPRICLRTFVPSFLRVTTVAFGALAFIAFVTPLPALEAATAQT